jgi:hypothetical protein
MSLRLLKETRRLKQRLNILIENNSNFFAENLNGKLRYTITTELMERQRYYENYKKILSKNNNNNELADKEYFEKLKKEQIEEVINHLKKYKYPLLPRWSIGPDTVQSSLKEIEAIQIQYGAIKYRSDPAIYTRAIIKTDSDERYLVLHSTNSNDYSFKIETKYFNTQEDLDKIVPYWGTTSDTLLTGDERTPIKKFLQKNREEQMSPMSQKKVKELGMDIEDIEKEEY